MTPQGEVLLMTTDSGVSSSVAAALQTNGHVLGSTAAHDPRELLVQLARTPSSVVLVDVDPHPRQLLPQLERIIERFPGARFVALASAAPSELLLEAMQAGVRRVVLKQSLRSELGAVLNRIAPSGGTGERGTLITVLSAGGGSGATTTAINLANELGGQQPGRPSLLVDLDMSYGAAATFLGIDARYALDHLLSHGTMMDTSLVTSTATAHSAQLHFLASPASTQFSRPPAVDWQRIEQLLDVARLAYRYTVVDAPRIPMDVAAALVGMSTWTMLVFQLNVKDVRTARAMLDALSERAVPISGVMLVAARYVKRQMVSVEDARQALGGGAIQLVRNDFPAAAQCMNYGKMLADGAPRSVIRRDIQSLVERVLAGASVVAATGQPASQE
jgi:pilus assembly protein CpaE